DQRRPLGARLREERREPARGIAGGQRGVGLGEQDRPLAAAVERGAGLARDDAQVERGEEVGEGAVAEQAAAEAVRRGGGRPGEVAPEDGEEEGGEEGERRDGDDPAEGRRGVAAGELGARRRCLHGYSWLPKTARKQARLASNAVRST